MYKRDYLSIQRDKTKFELPFKKCVIIYKGGILQNIIFGLSPLC